MLEVAQDVWSWQCGHRQFAVFEPPCAQPYSVFGRSAWSTPPETPRRTAGAIGSVCSFIEHSLRCVRCVPLLWETPAPCSHGATIALLNRQAVPLAMAPSCCVLLDGDQAAHPVDTQRCPVVTYCLLFVPLRALLQKAPSGLHQQWSEPFF